MCEQSITSIRYYATINLVYMVKREVCLLSLEPVSWKPDHKALPKQNGVHSTRSIQRRTALFGNYCLRGAGRNVCKWRGGEGVVISLLGQLCLVAASVPWGSSPFVPSCLICARCIRTHGLPSSQFLAVNHSPTGLPFQHLGLPPNLEVSTGGKGKGIPGFRNIPFPKSGPADVSMNSGIETRGLSNQ